VLSPEGAPALLRDRIAEGRAAILAQRAKAVAPASDRGLGSSDPELTARVLSLHADEAMRLVLTDPERD
jgi:hypothetical protein